MNPRHPATLPALAALLAALCPRAIPAAERGCPALAVEPDAGFRGRFPDLLERIQSELTARSDLDACARVGLRLQGEAIGVSVTLPDGRAASRSVARSEDLIPTLQALLLVPEPAPTIAAEPPASREAPARPKRRAAPVAELTERDVVSTPIPEARQLGFELSVISGARIGDGQFGYGAGALSFLQVHSWLIGFEGRADGYRSIHGGDPETALELAILAGKRFDFGAVALDLTAGPAMAMKGVAFSQSESVRVEGMGTTMPAPVPAPPPRTEPSTGPIPRLLVGARLGFSPRSVFRTFVGLDGELGPAQAPTAPTPEVTAPRMPTFTVGLALGATIGTR
jgi:hypothetical protein